MTDPTNNSEDMYKKLSRRNWLRNAAIAATSAVVLPSFLTGCTKEQWNHLKNTPHHGGGLGEYDFWYKLKITYQDELDNNNTKVGLVTPLDDGYGYDLDQNLVVVPYTGVQAARFKLHPTTQDGWADWELDDDDHNYMTIRLDGWCAAEGFHNKVSWQIGDNGKLWTNYDYWKDYPIGVQWDTIFGYGRYWLGANLSNGNVAKFELI